MEYKLFDENDAVKFIRDNAPTATTAKYSDDDLLLLIDTLFDFFDTHDKGDDDFDPSIADITAWVQRQLKKDRLNNIDHNDVEALVTAELKYEETLDL